MLPFSWSFYDWIRAALGFSAGLLGGVAIWWSATMVTAHDEPWSIDARHYLAALLAAGFLVAMIFPKAFWIGPLAVVVGQLLYLAYLYEPDGVTQLPIAVGVALVSLLPVLAGSLGGVVTVACFRALAAIFRWATGRRRVKR